MSGLVVPSDPTRIDISVDPTAQRMVGTARHGDTPFDVPYVSHIEGNLWTGGCTTGLVLPREIEHVISLYPWEQYTLSHQPKSVSFNWLYDAEMADARRVIAIARHAANCMNDGPTLVHCQAGLNRSGLIAALVLMLGGRTSKDAIALLRRKRSPAVLCNAEFEKWLTTRAGAVIKQP